MNKISDVSEMTMNLLNQKSYSSVISLKKEILQREYLTLDMKTYFVYIMSSPNKNSIYIGVTNDLQRRVKEHKSKTIDGFTSKYNCIHLVHFESFNDIEKAIQREKQIKKWNRKWKNELILSENNDWLDLADSW